jgi:hypothetical protein
MLSRLKTCNAKQIEGETKKQVNYESQSYITLASPSKALARPHVFMHRLGEV